MGESLAAKQQTRIAVLLPCYNEEAAVGATVEGFRRALPQAEVHAFDDAGHYVLEDRHEVLVPAIRAFLDRT